jgi:hypothetical protein
MHQKPQSPPDLGKNLNVHQNTKTHPVWCCKGNLLSNYMISSKKKKKEEDIMAYTTHSKFHAL